MNKNELIAELADKCEMTKAQASDCIDAFCTIVSKAMSKGEEVRLVGFGTFCTVYRRATEGRNPRTGAVIKIPAANKPKFKAGKALSEMVNKGSKKKAA
jgi:DNA-binding protein HU-beta